MGMHERRTWLRPAERSAGDSAWPSRRGFLGLVGAGTITAATVPGGVAAASVGVAPRVDRRVPRTLAWSGGGAVVRPGFAVEEVGVVWPAGRSGGRIRLAGAAGRFGPWRSVGPGCGGGAGDHDAHGPHGPHGALVPAGRAAAYEVDLPPGTRTVALNSTDGPSLPAPVGERGAAVDVAGCLYLSRAAWGADESLRFDAAGMERFPPVYWPVQTVTVHHTATVNDDPDPAARVRAIYRFQAVDEDFGDIGYHFLIDEAGRVYEGRSSGPDAIPGFDPAGRMVNAAHVAGFNAGNVGIALLGTFTDRAPSAPARRSLALLLAVILGWHRIDPLATVGYVNPISGVTRSVRAIPGHRDWAPTLCPGDVLAGELEAIRRDVAALLGGGSVAPASAGG
jgi:hypothetical protein